MSRTNKAAEAAYQEAIALNYPDGDYINDDLVEALYCKALELDPKHSDAANRLGVYLQSNYRYHEAYDYFCLALKLEPTDGANHYNVASACATLHGYNSFEVKEHLIQAIKLDPERFLDADEFAWIADAIPPAKYAQLKRDAIKVATMPWLFAGTLAGASLNYLYSRQCESTKLSADGVMETRQHR